MVSQIGETLGTHLFMGKRSPRGLVLKNPPAKAGDVGSIPGLGRSHREGNGTPLQYSSWEIPWIEQSVEL